MTKITKAEFDALPESLKTKFKADGDSYEMIEEDVEGLKKSKADILKEKKDLADKLAAYEKRIADIDAAQAADDEARQKKAGEFDELEKKLRAKLTETETKAAEREAELLGIFKTERLKNELTARGVIADRAKYALADIGDQIELATGDGGFSLKVKNGIGDAKEFDALIEGLKTTSPFLFASTAGTGGGASGNQGGGNVAPKTATKAQLAQMSPVQKKEFFTGGGEVSDYK